VSAGTTPLLYESSRQRSPAVPLSVAIRAGLAPDGGLYLPVVLPHVVLEGGPGRAGAGADAREAAPSLAQVAQLALKGFFQGDRLEAALPEIAAAALDFPAPTTPVSEAPDALFALELFHGPTAAFKDFGARFLAQSLERLQAPGDPPLTILVATSGDTGGAVAAAFHRRPWVRVVILYPAGLVSARQEQQLTCWGDNVISLRVGGTFDDCQRLVKEAFVHPTLALRHRFSSANSINIGRLLPQIVYYAASSLQIERQTQRKASYIIPAGNLGNAFAAVWARALGFPIERLVLAHNANRTVPDFFASGEWRPRPSIATLASAMDVGNPSNMERLRAQYPGFEELTQQLRADSVDDATIRHRIKEDFMEYGRVWCPHTATAAEVYRRLSRPERQAGPWVLVATAHPAKFNEVVEPLIGREVPVPPALARLLGSSRHLLDVPPTLEAMAAAIE
jgi:threonine synthase